MESLAWFEFRICSGKIDNGNRRIAKKDKKIILFDGVCDAVMLWCSL
jgi:hypothetical protein